MSKLIMRWQEISKKIRIIEGATANKIFLNDISNNQNVTTIGFVNQHALNLLGDDNFYNSLTGLDIILRDGIGTSFFLRKCNIDPGLNMNGTDFIPLVLDKYRGKNVALFGTKQPYLSRAVKIIEKEYGVSVTLIADGFMDRAAYKKMISSRKVDLVILGMGMPKQEMVAAEIKDVLPTSCVVICGGAIIDFIAGRVSRAPSIMRKFGLEWLYRLYKEPLRLFKRYVIGVPLFMVRLILLHT